LRTEDGFDTELGEGRDLTVPSPSGPSALALEDGTLRGARRIIDEGTPPNTRHAYRTDMKYIMAWCKARGLEESLPLSVETAVTFLVDHVEELPEEVERRLVRSGVKRDFGLPAISTVRRRMASMSTAHKVAGLPNPCTDTRVTDLLSRAVKAAVRKGWAPRKKVAAPRDTLDLMLATCDGNSLHDIRDRALLLFAWSSGGRRRSEAASAVIERLEVHGNDFVYRLGVTKTHQDGDSGTVPVAGRAADAMRAWLAVVGSESGPIFRGIAPDGTISESAIHPETVAKVVCRRAKRAGLDPARFGGHSLRSGYMTEAGLRGINIQEAMLLSGHRTYQVAASYYQAGAGLNNKGARLAG